MHAYLSRRRRKIRRRGSGRLLCLGGFARWFLRDYD
jgi:hypothetical protein